MNSNDSSLYYFNGFEDYSNYEELICLESGCYEFIMNDSYGDGWQGAEFELFSVAGDYVISGFLSNGFTESILFSINEDCNIIGCTDFYAENYNPSASIEDGSCYYTEPIFDNVNLLFNWNDAELIQNSFGGAYNEVYGFSINDHEYGIIGSTMGTHIIDVTNPSKTMEVSFIPGEYQGSGVTHRDFHTIDNYLYAVCDQGESTLQIVDLSYLPDTTIVVYDSSELFSRAHNIFIDELNYKLYSCSTTGNFSGTCIFDIQNPEEPEYLYSINTDSHDIYVENNIAYVNGNNGVWVYDCSSAPELISSLTEYPYQGSNHSGWKKDNTYIFADENFGYDVKVCDVSNINDIEVISTFNSEVSNTSIPHNLIIKDNFVFLSYYHDGLQIFDISSPSDPKKVGYYDTYLGNNDSFYSGAWGVYPLLPSGNILVSDMQSGLFVLDFNIDELIICEGSNVYLENEYQSSEGIYIDVINTENNTEDIIVTNLIVLPNNEPYDCFENCINDVDYDEICDELDDCIGEYDECGTCNGNGPQLYYDCDGNCISDIDGDEVCDELDNCPENYNPNQEDYNIDGVGDACDNIGLDEGNIEKTLIKVVDLLGREIYQENKDNILLYIYNDGSVQKKNIIE